MPEIAKPRFLFDEKGKRFSLPNSRIMVHQPSAGYQGQATDIEIHAKEILALKDRLNKIYSKHTKKTESEIKLCRRILEANLDKSKANEFRVCFVCES